MVGGASRARVYQTSNLKPQTSNLKRLTGSILQRTSKYIRALSERDPDRRSNLLSDRNLFGLQWLTLGESGISAFDPLSQSLMSLRREWIVPNQFQGKAVE